MVPRPATIPVTAPRALGRPNLLHSQTTHVSAPADAEICVTSIAMPASPLAASALPALNPNQPTQSNPAPVIVMVMLCGGMGCDGNPCLGPITMAATSAATPAVMCTTVPPAKSSRPISLSQPPPHTQWVIGA